MQGAGAFTTLTQPHLCVIVQVGTDAWHIERHLYAVFAQLVRRANPGQHQQLR